jgi:methyl-accepting chemotaxis protein
MDEKQAIQLLESLNRISEAMERTAGAVETLSQEMHNLYSMVGAIQQAVSRY